MFKSPVEKYKFILPVFFLIFSTAPAFSGASPVSRALSFHTADTIKTQLKDNVKTNVKDAGIVKPKDSIQQPVSDSILYKQRIFKAEELVR
jgi:hypothetical protein